MGPGKGRERAAQARCHDLAVRHALYPAAARLGDDETSAQGARGQDGAGAAEILTESQLAALEKAKADKEAHGEFESECPGYCGAQDTFYVGTLKGVGRVYQQTFIDTYAKVGFAKLYDRKTPLTAADLLNDRVIPFYDEHEVVLQRVLTDQADRAVERCRRHPSDLRLFGASPLARTTG
jgi:DNA-binding GntR family transcriptional regulator